MNYSEFKEKIINKCNEFLKKDGYLVKKNTLGATIFIKRKENEIFSIGSYSNKYGTTIVNRSIGAGITCLEIENIFVPIVVKNGFCGKSLKPDTNPTIGINKIPGFETVDFSKYQEDIVITDEEGVNILASRIKEYYYDIATPAFNAFTSIEQLVPMIKNVDVFKINEILHFGILKKAIIYKLCNVKEYDEYITERIKLLKNSLDQGGYDHDVPKWYNTFIELKQILDNTLPKYNI